MRRRDLLGVVTKKLRAEIRRRRESQEMLDGKLVPGSVPFIRLLLSTATDPHERDDLLGELAGECLRADLDDEHLLVQRERVANHPGEAIMWLGLAHTLSMRADGADEAKHAAAKGVEIARRAQTLIRYALTCQADVARKTIDASLYVNALRALIADASNVREDDRGLDDSILRDLPDGFCPADVQADFRRMLDQYGPGHDGPDPSAP